ncbi:hypothetical protein LguiA_027727 [Lonicera macranthoides]
MAKLSCDFRYLLIVAAVAFIYIQMRLFTTQSQYADRLAAAVEAENHCTSQMRLLIDQISTQQGRIVAIEELLKKMNVILNPAISEERNRRDQECRQLRALVQDLERKGLKKLVDEVQVPVAAVVVMACNRADYLEKTIKSILKYQKPVASKYPLFVSQDGPNPDVRSKALSYDQLTYMQHLDYKPVHTERPGELIAYYKIATLRQSAKSRPSLSADDMEISPDFFDYFEAGATLLDSDKSIMAISSWNDNGQKQFVHDPFLLISLQGSSLGQYFKQYLEPIKMNDVDWKSMDLSYLMEDKYVQHFGDIIKSAKPVHGADAVLKAYNIDGDVRIKYYDQTDFERIARQFGIFEEWKDGVPRTAYKGVVVFRYQTSRRIFLVGPDSLQQLGIENS